MAAEIEEVVLAAHLRHPQHLRPDRRQHLLHRRAGSLELTRRAPLRSGQGAAVELAVGRHRQRLQQHEGRGHHVLRKPTAQRLAQLARRGSRLTRRHHVGHQALVARLVLARQHHRLAHSGQVGQRHLDLPQLDPVAADLHLLVQTAQELQQAIRPVARPVTRAVEPHPRPMAEVTEGIGQEGRRRQLRPRVARAQAVAADVEVPRHPDRTGGKAGVQHVVAERWRSAGHRGCSASPGPPRPPGTSSTTP